MTGRVYTAAERRALIDVARVAALLLRETVPALAPVTDFSRWLDYAVRGEPFPNNAVDRAHVGSRSNTLMAIHVIDEAIQWVVRGNAREATTCARVIPWAVVSAQAESRGQRPDFRVDEWKAQIDAVRAELIRRCPEAAELMRGADQ